MLFIPNTSTDPYYNQAFEQAVFELCTEDEILLIWRNRRAAVCGRNQNIFAEISVAEAEKENVALVRRDTGGGTVYHDEGNINYTLISNSCGISVNYDMFLDRVVTALNRMEIPAHRSKSCDIAINGRKISGSAQRQTKTRVLHHGTLLFDTDLAVLNRFSRDRSADYSSKAICSNRSNVTNICEHIKAPYSAEAFMSEFTENMLCMGTESKHCKGTVMQPNDVILNRANELVEAKYKTWEWTFGKNPPFNCEREANGIYLKFSAKHGIINDFVLKSDRMQINEDVFIGSRLEPQVIRKLCLQVMPNTAEAELLYEQIL